MPQFTGRWSTTFGPMQLHQDADKVHGVYTSRGQACTITGRIEGERLVFDYEEPGEAGSGWFTLTRHGKFAGKYSPIGASAEGAWTGHREFDGIWESTFGRLRLIQEEDRVFGYYEGCGSSTVSGTVTDGKLHFQYHEPSAAGEGWFAINDDGDSFHGEWRADHRPAWAAWTGKRVRPRTGQTWLLVLEAHWQRSIAEREYSFGRMLTEFFARYDHLAVRHRFFDDEAGLDRWCRELLYFPEPAVVLIASHGTPEGLNVGGRTINSKLVIDSLQHAENVSLLHFSSCLVMKEDHPGDFAKRIQHAVPFPISGYTTSVDWGGSAVIEFNYLDMILGKGLTPQEAADHLVNLVRYAGDEAPEGSPYPPAGFRFFAPGTPMDVPPGESTFPPELPTIFYA